MNKLIVICIFGFFICISLIDLIRAMPSENREESTLRAGTAKIEITPRFGRWASVEFPVPFYVRALVFEQGETRVALIICDMCLLTKTFIDSVNEIIANDTAIPASNIMTCATHTHSIPKETLQFLRKNKRSESSDVEKWGKVLSQKILQAVREASNRLTPAQVGLGKGFEDTIGLYSRRRMKNGDITWAGPTKDQGPPAGPYDPEVGVILIRDLDGAVIATVWNYTCHPMGSTESGDYVGWTCRAIEQELGGVALFTLGAAGNIHNDHVRYKPGEEMSKPITYEVLRVARNIEMSEEATIKSLKKEVLLPGRDFYTIDTKQIKAIASQAKQRSNKFESEWLKELEERKKESKLPITTSLQVLSIGDALLVGNPGELFVELGLQIKWNSGCENTFNVNCANDWIGYIPTRTAYQEGGYQTLQRARIAPGAGDQIVHEVLKLCSLITKK